MNRAELISHIAAQFPQLTQQDVYIAVTSILKTMGDHLASGGRIEARGFGSFQVNVRPPRLGRNPKTGMKVQVPARPTVHFKPGAELRERVNVEAELLDGMIEQVIKSTARASAAIDKALKFVEESNQRMITSQANISRYSTK